MAAMMQQRPVSTEAVADALVALRTARAVVGHFASSMLLASLLAVAAAAEPAARSGLYDGLTVVVAGRTVSGAFFDQRGEPGPGGAPPFSCVFLLRGALAGDTARITAWTPGETRIIPGELAFRGDGAVLKLSGEPSGCGMTSGDMVGRPYTMSRSREATGWLNVRMVAVKRAAFRPSPGKGARRAPFVVRFDPVVVLEHRSGWVRASYLGGSEPVTGWLRESDLAPSEPPGAR